MSDLTDLASALDIDFSLENPPEPQASSPSSLVKPDAARNLALFSRIPVTLTLEVASVEISLAELIGVGNDSVIELDKLAGEPLDVKVNGILFGKAEVVVLNDKYGLRLIAFNNHDLSELAGEL
ncbi:FliM/FliN family flagellar motor switch protein [Pantoea eucrina]|uniref:Flagellar motor switch protein FliN n=1 Tax=Pantoea eucrina TaxID=472693 RepID=A0ABU5LBL3_9GAMM|nr:FliM/FliN family flagellar motor switch protein [Pantoea eucrina]MDZ7277322.1 FliM/FliN family flagellar motor switch protein [Pantoea eucrina]